MCASAGIYPGEVMVSWLPLFHDMGMVGFLTLPMCRGIELVNVTPADFLSAPLLWPRLISQVSRNHHRRTEFRLRADRAGAGPRRTTDLDLSSLRFALNGAEPIDVRAVRAFLAAGQPFGLPETAMVCAYGMAEATLAVSFHPWGTPLKVDTVLAAELEQRAAGGAGAGRRRREGADRGRSRCSGRRWPASRSRCSATDGGTLGDREVGVLHLRGECGHRPLPDGRRAAADQASRRLARHRRSRLPGRRRGGGLRPGQGRHHHGRPQHLSDRHRAGRRVRGRRAGRQRRRGALADPSGRESFALAVESRQAAQRRRRRPDRGATSGRP